MKKCIVIGGGLAGLSSAAYLSQSGFSVEIIEASSRLGGRAYSFTDKQTGSLIDNGQHILMGCYKETLRFFKLIGAEKNLFIQKKLEVNYLKPGLSIQKLKTSSLPYPFSLLFGLLNYKALSLKERLIFLKFFLKIYLYSGRRLEKLSVAEWLELEGQTENIQKAFWELLAVGALNTNIKKASAKTFSIILKKIFFRGNRSASIIIPGKGLSEAFCSDAENFIKKNNGKISFSEEVTALCTQNEKITGIRTNKREIRDFDFIVSAVPLYALQRILPGYGFEGINEFEYSTIVTIHIWLKENPLSGKFYGLIDSPVQWIFNHDSHLTLVISDANYLSDVSKEEIFNTAAEELSRYAKIEKSFITNYLVIKEKRATFIPSAAILNIRPDPQSNFNNLIFAGDWINTGLPSTIESAVKSGRMAADLMAKDF
ncbi:MAG TPA: hydroxysqualene dehydroxylase HpnE [Ignavibacteriaceae bacterium]|nr:hydroxysqualene dehydroxylase HpnE [Ignavibacteriaceae bacterium]